MKTKISILLFTIIAAVCSAQSQEYSFSEKYNVENLTHLFVDVEVGNISVFSSNEPGIRVNFIAKKNQKLIKIERADLEKYFTIEVKKSENSITILTKPTRKGNNKRWSNSIDLTLEIMVPNTTPCDLHTADGNISVKDLKGNQKCKVTVMSILGVNFTVVE